MGNPKQKWTAEEEEALRAGVAKHGTGKWKNIQKDPEFNHLLYSRSNIDLKDKWRNLSVSAGIQPPRDKSKTLKPKPLPDSSPVPSSSEVIIPLNVSSFLPDPVVHSTSDQFTDDKFSLDDKSSLRQTEMIIEALAALKSPNGSDATAIFNFIEDKHQVPQTFRRLLSSRLRRMVQQEKLDKVQNCYKLRTIASPGTRVAVTKEKDNRAVEDAAATAAYRIAEAENKSFVAGEAMKEVERISLMAEETESFLQVAKEIFQKCLREEFIYAL